MLAGAAPILIVAHPGHELRLFHWMERTRPTVFVLTDGSGGGAEPRTLYSRRVLEAVGARCGRLFGAAPDREWYDVILCGDVTPFQDVVDAAVNAALSQGAQLIVTDAVDGYNPMHDLCAAIGAAVVAQLRHRAPMTEHLVSRAVAGRGEDVVQELELDSDSMKRKQANVEAYRPLAEEVRRVLEEEPGALDLERLARPTFAWPEVWRPQWEEIGRERVALSRYRQPIEYVKHVLPLARTLLESNGTAFEEVRNCAS